MTNKEQPMVLSPIRLVDQQLVDMTCKVNSSIEEYSHTQQRLNIKTSIGNIDIQENSDIERHVAFVHVNSVGLNVDESIEELTISVTVRGVFEIAKSAFINFPEEAFFEAIRVNMISVLYSSARGHVEHITALTQYGKVLLPTINVQKYLDCEQVDEG